jgi:hypothetical protein
MTKVDAAFQGQNAEQSGIFLYNPFPFISKTLKAFYFSLPIDPQLLKLGVLVVLGGGVAFNPPRATNLDLR